MIHKTLLTFQARAVESGVALFTHAKSQLDAVGNDPAGRALVVNHNGYLLIEAPTGAGKTLIAGNIAERLSAEEEVVWFWFAPFKGVTGQTVQSLRDEFPGLRLRDLQTDRAAEGSRGGDVFVTTWQAVATRTKDKRNVRKDGDENPSMDGLIAGLRAMGLRIGAVVDEAHHGFHTETLAARFFAEVLRPDYTMLVTATPDDREVARFREDMGIAGLQRIRVSREDAREAGLIKDGIKCAAYFVAPEKAGLADLPGTALRDAVATHRQIKRTLAEGGLSLVPLLLVQAKDQKSVAALREKIVAMGFAPEQVRTHTAREPDAGLLAIANDESVEVLIFIMAVALGFDAPRAFTLASLHASRDSDFGVQLVGRILRVHRRLHGRAREGKLPEVLRHGYVFLADAESQEGLDEAGRRINEIRTEYAKISPATVVVRVGGTLDTGGGAAPAVHRVGADGQVELFPAETTPKMPGDVGGADGDDLKLVGETVQTDFDLGEFFNGGPGAGDSAGTAPAMVSEARRYALRAGMPRRFKTQTPSADNKTTEADCAARFIVGSRALLDALKKSVGVERRTLEVFTREMQTEMDFKAELSVETAALLAQKALLKSRMFDPRELKQALLRKLEAVLREEDMAEEADDPAKVKHFLHVILATHPRLLREAQRAAIAAHATIEEAADLPPEVVADRDLIASPKNIYGVVPADLNGWERAFAAMLDRSAGGTFLWWHRNLPHKPWSVNVLLPDGRGFYPDFVVGVEGRNTEDHVLLADPKVNFERSDEAAKSQARHGVYGRVLVLHLDSNTMRWLTVGYDAKRDKPVSGEEFRAADAAGY